MMLIWCLWLGLAAGTGARAALDVTVIQMRLQYDEECVLPLNSTVEYILDYTPPPMVGGAEDDVPSVVRVRSDGGDAAHPVLVTARLRAGAITWQLPYESGGVQLMELERTLCPDDTAVTTNDTACAGEEQDVGAKRRGTFSLHVSTSCASEVIVRIRVRLPDSWRLPFGVITSLNATQVSPRVYYYKFEEEQESVRLVVASEDNVCAVISVQNYSCPIAQDLSDVSITGLRMTVQRSGGAQLSRSQFPRGFYVVALVRESEAPCGGTEDDAVDWLWAEAVLGDRVEEQPYTERRKQLSFTIEPALSREQYAVAIAVTMAVFLAFYVVFGALVWAQRWPPFAKYVKPKAVLAHPTGSEEMGEPQTIGSPVNNMPARRHRRGSADTFDSSDASDSDNERDTVTTANATVTTVTNTTPATSPNNTVITPQQGVATFNGHTAVNNDLQGPFGLPPQLRLAVLARRRERTLRARSDRYLYTLATVAVFYALPVIQFVATFQIILNVSGTLDICYYNFLCAHPAGALSDFNHVLSNLGYLLLGALFLLQVHRRRLRRKREPRDQEYGIPAHYGMLSALGAGMMVVAVLSASYHVCPNQLNFQFDTAFMYVLAVLSMVKIYQSRHPDVNARAHATFGVLAVIIAIVLWGVLGGGPLFWGVFTVLHVFTFLLLSLRMYYVGQFRLEKESLAAAARELRRDVRPQYSARLAMLLIGNAVNWMFAIYGLLTQTSDFAGHMLMVLLGNTLLYMMTYLTMKLVQRERLRWYAWCFLGGAAAAWAPALYFFQSGSSDWSAAPAQSRHLNHHCKVLEFYDSHDLWHMLSAVALYFSFNTMLTWDDGLSAVKRTDIAVF